MALITVVGHRLHTEPDPKSGLQRLLAVRDVLVLDDGRKRRLEITWVVSAPFVAISNQEPARLRNDRAEPRPRESWDAAARREAASFGSAPSEIFVPHFLSHVWLFQENTYLTEDFALTSADVRALVSEQANRRRLQLERAHALQAMTEQLDRKVRREPIPQDVKLAVWQRDRGRCIDCDSPKDLEFDHIIPLSLGGSNTMRNLQLLCAPCNRRKGATLG